MAGHPETANTYANYLQDGAVTTFEEVEKFSDVTPNDAIEALFYDHPNLYEASEDYKAAQKNMSRLWEKVFAGEIDEENLNFGRCRRYIGMLHKFSRMKWPLCMSSQM